MTHAQRSSSLAVPYDRGWRGTGAGVLLLLYSSRSRGGQGKGGVAGTERVATSGVEPVTDVSLFECTRMGSSAPAPAGTRWSSSMRRAFPPLPLSFSASVGSSKLTRTRSLPLPELIRECLASPRPLACVAQEGDQTFEAFAQKHTKHASERCARMLRGGPPHSARRCLLVGQHM